MALSCAKCGSINPLGAEICGDCGEILVADSAPIENQDNMEHVNQLVEEYERIPEVPILSKAKTLKAPLLISTPFLAKNSLKGIVKYILGSFLTSTPFFLHGKTVNIIPVFSKSLTILIAIVFDIYSSRAMEE